MPWGCAGGRCTSVDPTNLPSGAPPPSRSRLLLRTEPLLAVHQRNSGVDVILLTANMVDALAASLADVAFDIASRII